MRKTDAQTGALLPLIIVLSLLFLGIGGSAVYIYLNGFGSIPLVSGLFSTNNSVIASVATASAKPEASATQASETEDNASEQPIKYQAYSGI